MSHPHEGVDCESAWPQAQRGYDAIARENVTLRAYYNAQVDITVALHVENAKLRAALEKYGEHSASCTYFPPNNQPCDCGLAAELGGTA